MVLSGFRLRDCHPLWLAFPHHSANRPRPYISPTTPEKQAPRVWAFPRSLATTSGIISFPLGTKMFQFPRLPSCIYVFNTGYARFARMGFPIRRSPDQRLYTAPRGLSQCPTSFFGIWRQGIHRKLLVA